MSGLFDRDEDRAVEKLMRAGASNRTILAAMPTDRDGGIDPPPRKIVEERFPKPHQQMPTYERGVDREILYETPVQIIDERFPNPDEVAAVTADLNKHPTIRKAIKRKRDEHLRERRKR